MNAPYNFLNKCDHLSIEHGEKLDKNQKLGPDSQPSIIHESKLKTKTTWKNDSNRRKILIQIASDNQTNVIIVVHFEMTC